MKTTKICTKCDTEKTISDFYFRKDSNSYRNECKKCNNAQSHKYKNNNIEDIKKKQKQRRLDNIEVFKERDRIYYQNNKEACKKKRKEYVDNNKEKVKECAREYTIDNKESIAINKKKYYDENRDKILEDKKTYYKENINDMLIKNKTYYKNNRKKLIEQVKRYSKTPMGMAVKRNMSQRRRAIKKDTDITSKDMARIECNATVCYWCEKKIVDKKFHLDHYMPLSKGGTHTLDNVVVACPSCNLSKHCKEPIVFANSIGKLF